MEAQIEHRPWYRHYPQGVPREISVRDGESLASLIEETCRRNAARVAASCLGEQLTYAQLDTLSRQFAARLQQAGLRRGDRVALMMPNCLPYLVGLAGVLRAGMIVVTVNPLYTPREVGQQLADSGARAILVAAPFAAAVGEVRPQTALELVISTPVVVGASDLGAAIGLDPGLNLTRAEIDTRDIALLQYTGGTTGVSKGAMLTHASVLASLAQLRSWSGFSLEGEEASVVTPLPLYHVYPLAIALMAMAIGAENRLIPNPRDTTAVIAEFRRRPFELLIGVNTLFNALVENPALKDVDFSATRLVTGAGASVQGAVARRWEDAGGPKITEGYGLTETSPSATFNLLGRNGCIGMPVPSTDVKVVDEDGEVVAMGTPGELLIRGPQLFAGYWQREEETLKAFTEDGWFRTGDIVVMDETGCLAIVDRKKDMILVSGFNVYPNEIEAVVAGMGGVLECACIGMPDPRTGEAPHLFVVAREKALAPEEVEAHCRANLAAYKVPRRISFVEALPKSAVGKILRRELRSG
ncbi:MAG TPA: AMP-binding protein [Ramlibacter sp.]|nr:AMP-binding protein [Ramlibacter sp.]